MRWKHRWHLFHYVAFDCCYTEKNDCIQLTLWPNIRSSYIENQLFISHIFDKGNIKASIFGISPCRHRWSCANARCELFSNLWLYHWVRSDSLLRLLVFHLFCVYPVSRLLTSMHQMGVTADFSTNISDLVVQTQFFWRFCYLYPVFFSYDHLSDIQRFYK